MSSRATIKRTADGRLAIDGSAEECPPNALQSREFACPKCKEPFFVSRIGSGDFTCGADCTACGVDLIEAAKAADQVEITVVVRIKETETLST
jgi:ribosomal protein L37AE/L43A